MELSRRTPWRAIIERAGKTHSAKLLGGASQEDEVVAFDVALEKGDLIRLSSGPRTLGFDCLDSDEADVQEQGGAILVGVSGSYDLRLSTKRFGNERLRILRPTAESKAQKAVQKKNLKKMRAHAAKEKAAIGGHNFFIALLALIWLIPVIWLVLVSFTGNLHGPSLSQFFPEKLSIENYAKLFTVINDVNQFPRWFLNTLIVSVCSTIVSTIFVLATAFAFSRFRFRKRKGLMNLSMIIALFPGMLTMLVSYYLFEYVFKINAGLVRLIIAYSAGAGLGYLVAKGFFDTIPTSIDEAAKLDGASSFRIFFQILVPLSKPIIIYTIITAFLAPWVDFVFAKIILGNSALPPDYTVAMGLINLISSGNILDWFGAFAAGSVIISIPLSILFLLVQKYYVGGVTGGAVKG